MAQKHKSRAESEQSKRNVLIAAGVATGIGSAALVAALLYANRGKKAEAVSPNSAEPTD
jgi:Tfp pilus assembly protein PilN